MSESEVGHDYGDPKPLNCPNCGGDIYNRNTHTLRAGFLECWADNGKKKMMDNPNHPSLSRAQTLARKAKLAKPNPRAK